MSEAKVPAQATIEEQLANAKQEIQWLRDEAQVRKKELRERIFYKIFEGGYERVGHELAIERTAKVVAFILGDGVYPPIHPPSEIDEIHAYLDTMGILREGSPGNPLSLLGRIMLLANLGNTAIEGSYVDRGHVTTSGRIQIESPNAEGAVWGDPLPLGVFDTAYVPVRNAGVWLMVNGNPIFLQAGENIQIDRIVFKDEFQSTGSPIQVAPDRHMIPLVDLTVWIQDNIPPMLQVGLNANPGRERKILLELAKHFGIPESNLEPPA